MWIIGIYTEDIRDPDLLFANLKSLHWMDADIKSHIKHSGSSFGGLECEKQTIWTESVYLLYEIPLHIVLNSRYEKLE